MGDEDEASLILEISYLHMFCDFIVHTNTSLLSSQLSIHPPVYNFEDHYLKLAPSLQNDAVDFGSFVQREKELIS